MGLFPNNVCSTTFICIVTTKIIFGLSVMTEDTDIEPLLTISNSPCDGENQIHKS